MSLRRNLDRPRWVIIWIWFGCLILNVVLLAYTDVSQYQTADDPGEGWREPILRLYRDVVAIYVTPLTTMFAIAFARNPVPTPSARPGPAFWIAVTTSLLWNCVMLFQNARMSVFHSLDVKSLDDSLSTLPGVLSFLLTPVLAFYFSSEPA